MAVTVRGGTLVKVTTRPTGAPVEIPPEPAADLAAARLAVCRAPCPHYQPAVDRCRQCGCSDTMQRRTQSRVGTCPDGRWP